MNTKTITQFTAWDFLVEVQGAVLDGYRLSDDNDKFPQVSVGLYTVTLVKEGKPEPKPTEVTTEVTTEEIKTIGSRRGKRK